MKQMLKHIWKLLVLIIFLAGTFSYAMFQGGFVSWFLFYSFLPFALFALVLAFYPLKGFKVDRSFSKTKLSAGEELKVTIRLTRWISLFPLFYIVLEDAFDSSTRLNLNGSEKIMAFPWFQKVIEYEYTIEDLPRGEHFFHSVTIKTSDLFGFIEKGTSYDVPGQILVYPAYENIYYNSFSHHFDQGKTSSMERVQRDTTVATGVREYQPGDRFSWINWKATAKGNTIMTKEFDQRKSYDVLLVMDCSPTKSFETIVSFTASIIKGMLKEGVQVGLLTSGLERGRFSVLGGEKQQQELFYHLAKVKDNGAIPLHKVLDEENTLLRQNAILMLVTSQAQLTHSLLEKAGFLSVKKGKITIFNVQDENYVPARPSDANGKGVRIISVVKGHFADAFSVVNKG